MKGKENDMETQRIAVNSKHTGDPRKDHRGYAASWTPAQLDALLAEDWLRQMVADIRGGNEQLKEQLPYLCPHYAAFRNDHRAQADILPETFTFMTCVDVDDPAKVDKAVARALELNADADGDWYGQVLRIAYSARKKVHIYIRMPRGKTIAEAQQAFCDELGDVDFDESCTTPERFIYLTGRDEEIYRSEHWLEPLSEDELGERREAYLMRGLDADGRPLKRQTTAADSHATTVTAQRPLATEEPTKASLTAFDLCVAEAGLKADEMDVWGVHNWHANLMAVLSVGVGKLMSREQLCAVVAQRLPNYAQTNDCRTLIDYFYEKYAADKGFMNTTLRDINAKAQQHADDCDGTNGAEDYSDEEEKLQAINERLLPRKMPQGVRDSIEAAGTALTMPVVTAICPCIGALATGVRLDIHKKKCGLNLISYIAGDFASGKGQIDPVVAAWMSEMTALDEMYMMQEDEWRAKKRAAKNKKEQPEEPKLPVRCLTLNNTVANLAERLANTQGKHAFSFTPEADTVSQKWKTSVSDFSVMLRQSYDGSKYDREARSAEAVNVHIRQLLWNVTMCGTPDALYRVVNNYTDGFQSRIAVARTPDNTFEPLDDNPSVLTPRQTERIQQIAHLLPLMQGEVVLPKLENRGRAWLERIRLQTMMDDDRVKARQRIRVCMTAQRMTCCLMLCKVCETLIQKYGLAGAENRLKQHPDLWRETLIRTQTPTLLNAFDAIADSLIENALFFFRERIENAFGSRDYAGYQNSNRSRHGRNDTIFERLDPQFTFDQLMQHSVAVKGALVSRNTIYQMLKNWRQQGLIEQIGEGRYRKKL